MYIKLEYQINYNGWLVNNEDDHWTDQQVEQIEDHLPLLTHHLCDEDGYNGDGLDRETEDKIIAYVKSVVGDQHIVEIEFDQFSS